MRNKRRKLPRLGAREIALALLLVVAALLLAWEIVRTSAVDALLRERPFAARLAAPDNPRAIMAVAMAEFRLRNGTLSKSASSQAIAASAKAPLTEEPFLLAGLIARMGGDAARAERLLTEARHRNPRSRLARLMLLDHYLRTSRMEEAAGEIAVLTALVPQTTTVLVPELTRLVRNPETRPAMVTVLRRDAEMQQAVLEQLASGGADPDLILSVAGLGKGSGSSTGGTPWQALLLDNLVKKGDVGRAYRLWRSFTGRPTPDGGNKMLYDGRFEGLPGVPPFNWKLAQGNAGIAERTKGPALDVAYYGRDMTELASQLLMLSPGRYRLQFRAEGNAKGEGSRLVWTLACHPRQVQLMELPLRNIDYSPRVIAYNFTVPPTGCAAQWLKLSGIQAEFPASQNVTISDVQIRKGGAS